MKKCMYVICKSWAEETVMFAKWLELLQSDEFKWCQAHANLQGRLFQIPQMFDIKITSIDPDCFNGMETFIMLHADTYVAGANITAEKFFERYSNPDTPIQEIMSNGIAVCDYDQFVAFVKFLLWTGQLRNELIKEIKERKKNQIEGAGANDNVSIYDINGIEYLVEGGKTYYRIERICDAFFVDPVEYFCWDISEVGKITSCIMQGKTYVFGSKEKCNRNYWIKDDETMEEAFGS